MRIALVNANGGLGYALNRWESNAGLMTLKEALEQDGFNDIKLFPENDFREAGTGNLDRIAKEVIDYGPDVVGISAMSQYYNCLMYIASQIKKSKDAVIIAGGPHFKFDYYDTEKQISNSVIGASLIRISKDGEKCIDGVVVGHCQPFVDFLKSFGTPQRSLPAGLYVFGSEGVYGQGVGSFPKISKAPYSINEMKHYNEGKKNRHFTVIGNSKCPNMCDYCALDSSKIDITPEMIVSSIRPHKDIISYISLVDSSPFFYPTYYKEVFRAIRKEGISRPISTYLDSSLIGRNRDEVFSMIKEFLLPAFFIGREVTTEASARAIGRNFLGKPRTQEMLDNEKKYISELIEYIRTIDFGVKAGVKISYMLSPFDSLDAIIAVFDEILEFKRKAPEEVDVGAQINLIEPFPGTEIRKKYIDFVEKPNDFMGGGAYRWDPKKFQEHALFFTQFMNLSPNAEKRFSMDSLKKAKKIAKDIFK